MTQSTLHSGLTSTLYPTYALFPQISERHPP